MPLGLKLPPLFARSKTASSTTSSEPEPSATTAASSTVLNSSSLTDLKKSTSILHRRRGRSRASLDRVAPSDDKSVSPPPTAPSFGVDSTLLGSVGEEKEDLDGSSNDAIVTSAPTLILQEATPPTTDTDLPTRQVLGRSPLSIDPAFDSRRPQSADISVQDSIARRSSNASPKHVSRRPSIVDSANATLIQQKVKMPRKIWVKRPGASATLVQVREDDLVDDVRDMILRKYANSLGRTFDAPDMTLRIVARSEIVAARTERTLGPEEEICRTIDLAYPGGQTVEEALVIDVPIKRTPKPSPRAHQQGGYHPMDDYRPVESGTDYFPPMPALQPMLSGTAVTNFANHQPAVAGQDHQRSMAVLTTGQLPPLPSPGSNRRYREHRPKFGRQHTSSPTIVQHNPPAGMPHTSIPANMVLHRVSTRPRVDSSASESHNNLNGILPQPSALPTPPIPEAPPLTKGQNSSPPTPSTTAITLNPNRAQRPRKGRKPTPEKSLGRPRKDRHGSHDSPAQVTLPPISNMLEGIVPPINVLLVEDNNINLKVLQTLMKRLKVRWESAMNGKIAVDKWRKGGYHLILMDIQMPVMNGLQATKEIRRLEKVNGIGVFSSSVPSSPEEKRVRQEGYIEGVNDEKGADTDATETPKRDLIADKLVITEGTFKSPIIIVALTASSLQSDRHEALAAGCNDFLTKPVHLPWLERKVKEWGCMQALIDFDGWKRWRDINEKEEAGKSEGQKAKEREQDGEQKKRSEKQAANKKAEEMRKLEDEKRKRAAQRASIDGSAVINSNGVVNGH